MSVPLAEAFQFCPRCGRAVDRPGRNPLVCPVCDFRFYFTPVTGVVGIVANAAGEVLLLERARDPGRGKYGLPGGFVDPGETAEDALIREVREEVHLTVSRLAYLASYPNAYTYRGVTIPVTDVIYVCRVASYAPLRADPQEIAGTRLCRPGPHELERMAFDSNRRALELYLRGRSPLDVECSRAAPSVSDSTERP
jgi:mutator protein MutT